MLDQQPGSTWAQGPGTGGDILTSKVAAYDATAEIEALSSMMDDLAELNPARPPQDIRARWDSELVRDLPTNAPAGCLGCKQQAPWHSRSCDMKLWARTCRRSEAVGR